MGFSVRWLGHASFWVEVDDYGRFRSPGSPFHPKGTGLGYLITAAGRTISHGGDTDFIREMKALKNIDLALLPSGGTYTMDNPEAAEAALTIRPKVIIPMHRWDSNPARLKSRVEGASNIKVVLLEPSEEYRLE